MIFFHSLQFRSGHYKAAVANHNGYGRPILLLVFFQLLYFWFIDFFTSISAIAWQAKKKAIFTTTTKQFIKKRLYKEIQKTEDKLQKKKNMPNSIETYNSRYGIPHSDVVAYLVGSCQERKKHNNQHHGIANFFNAAAATTSSQLLF